MLICDDVVYYDFEGVVFDFDERECFVVDMGEKGSFFLCNYGILIVGEMCVDVWLWMYYLE